MGCQLSKLASSERKNTGAISDPPAPYVDPRLPLTAKQKYTVIASWKGISRAMEKTGICMFINDCDPGPPGPQRPPSPPPRAPRPAPAGVQSLRLRTLRLPLLRLFEDNAELLELFVKFRQCKTKDEQANSLELAEHANNVMMTLDEGIKSLDNLDNFFVFIHQIGATHYRIPGFHKAYFWKIEKPFMVAVEQTLGDRFTPNVESIYKITIRFIVETLCEGYDIAEAKAAGSS